MKEIKLWKWILLFVFGFFFFFVIYAIGQIPIIAVKSNGIKCALLILAAVAVLGFYVLWVRLFEKRKALELSLSKFGKDVSHGFAIGFIFFVAVTGIMMACGCYHVNGFGSDYLGILIFLIEMILVAVGEEVIFRGILYRMIAQRWSYIPALVVSALFFGLIHIFNPGATLWSAIAIAIEAGLLLGMAYEYSQTLWLPIGIHWGWNWVQGSIFGFPVSGQDFGASLIQSSTSGPDLISGGIFGAEASVIAVLVGIVFTAAFYRGVVSKAKNRQEESQLVEE